MDRGLSPRRREEREGLLSGALATDRPVRPPFRKGARPTFKRRFPRAILTAIFRPCLGMDLKMRATRKRQPLKATAHKPATYADLSALPEGVVGEILGGDLIVSPRPALEHARASSVLGVTLGGPFDSGSGGPGGWWILDEPELHLGEDVLVPDLAGWRRERCPSLPSGPFASLAPDWVCEVLSRSTAAVDRVRKMPVYLREGVTHCWLVDAGTQSLEVFRSHQGAWTLVGNFGGSGPVRAEPFEALEFDLGKLWI